MQANSNQRRAVKLMALGILLVCGFLFHTWVRTQVVKQGYAVAKARSEFKQLEDEWNRTKVERNQLMGPQALEEEVLQQRRAGNNFQQPSKDQLLYWKSGEHK